MPVFPACAGVILANGSVYSVDGGFPRMRGGDPFTALTK